MLTLLLTDPEEEDNNEFIIDPVEDTKPRCPLCGGELVLPCVITGQAIFVLGHKGIDFNRPEFFVNGKATHFGDALCMACGYETSVTPRIHSMVRDVEVLYEAPDQGTD